MLYMAFFIPSMIFFTIIAAQYWELAYRTSETAFDSPWEPVFGQRAWQCPSVVSAYLQGYSLNFSAPFTKWAKSVNVYFVMALPVYFIALIWLVMAVFYPRCDTRWEMVYGHHVSASWPVETHDRFDHAWRDDLS